VAVSADRVFVGVDIGGTSVEAVVADPANRVLARGTATTDATSGRQVLRSAVEAIQDVLREGWGASNHIVGIGIGVPGQVDRETGVVRLALNLNFGDDAGFPIGREIAQRFNVPTSVENDARAAAVGAYEALIPDHPDLHVLAYLSIGTGIAAGVVIDGRLHRGRDGLAGEIGHVVVEAGGATCRCGLQGCLEAVAAGPAIARLWPGDGHRPAQGLFEAAAAGDPEAVRLAGSIGGHLANAVQWLALANGADLVVLGGGIGAIGNPVLAAVRTKVADWADRSSLARHMLTPDRVISMPHDFPTGAIGAAAIARLRLEDPGGDADGRA
jgi:glucokinase